MCVLVAIGPLAISLAAEASCFRVRPAHESDFPRLCDLGQNFYDEMKVPGKFSRECFTASWTSMVEMGIGELWVLESGEKIIGSIGFIVAPDPSSGERVASELFWFMDPEARGYGRMLLEKFESRARDLGCKRMLMVHLNGPRAETLSHLYERRGYKLLETHFIKEIT